jgi:hypothetical protein
MSLEHERIHDAFMDGKLAGEANYKQKVIEAIEKLQKEDRLKLMGLIDADDLKKELGYNND